MNVLDREDNALIRAEVSGVREVLDIAVNDRSDRVHKKIMRQAFMESGD